VPCMYRQKLLERESVNLQRVSYDRKHGLIHSSDRSLTSLISLDWWNKFVDLAMFCERLCWLIICRLYLLPIMLKLVRMLR
jgi:hypothetical protein